MSTHFAGFDLPLPRPPRRAAAQEVPPAPPSVARPAAVVVPPLVSLAMVSCGAVAAQASANPGPLLPAAALGVTLLAVLYVLRTVLTGLGRGHTASVAAVAVGLGLAGLSGLLLTPGLVHPIAVGTALVLSLFATSVAPRWRTRLMEHRRMPVSLLAGSELSAQAAMQRLESLHAFDVVSVIIPGREGLVGRRVLGRPVASASVGEAPLERRIVVSCPSRNEQVGAYVAQLVARGHDICSESAAVRRVEGRVDSVQADPLGLLMGLRHSRIAEWTRVVTAGLVALTLLVLLAPILLLLAVAIVIESGLPVFYRQTRVGWRGRLFEVLKFRTMHRDAEQRSGPVFATEEDPRITAVGRFLRTYRLDELPQLWNVVMGDMGLVGPRPERPHFFTLFRDDVPLFELRTCVRPGITGWAQVRLPYADDAGDARVKLEHDLYYVTRRSLLFDLAILFDTVNVALSGAGAR